jgi:hypothetical protein
MKKFSLSITLALMAILLAMLACSGIEATPSVSNIRMATDDTGETPTSSYAPGEEFYVFADVDALEVGSLIQAKWYAADVQDLETNLEISTSDYSYEAGMGYVYFQLSTSDGGDWPPGSYRVELFLDGTKVGEQIFTVR